MRLRFIVNNKLVAIGVRLADFWLRNFLITIASPQNSQTLDPG